MKRNVLISGGAGFIGSSLALKLIDKQYNVTILDNLSEQIHGKEPRKSPLYLSIKDKVKFIEGDVRDKEKWNEALKEQHIVVHFAAETGTGQSMYEISKYCDVNVNGTALLLDYLTNYEHNIEKVVVASSRAIYGEGKYLCPIDGDVYPSERDEQELKNGLFEPRCPICFGEIELRPTDEDSKIHPSSIYGITKQTQEEMVMVSCRSIGVPAVALRYQNVYGPGQSLSNPYTGILSIFSTLIKNNKEINIFEDGKESRDFVFIDDVVEATILAIEKKEAEYEVFNVGSGEQTSVEKVAHTLINAYASEIPIAISGNFRIGDIRHNVADLTKIRTKLGFNPKHTFEEGIQKFAKWVDGQYVGASRYESSLEEMREKGLFK